jgi:hypothetical protein
MSRLNNIRGGGLGSPRLADKATTDAKSLPERPKTATKSALDNLPARTSKNGKNFIPRQPLPLLSVGTTPAPLVMHELQVVIAHPEWASGRHLCQVYEQLQASGSLTTKRAGHTLNRLGPAMAAALERTVPSSHAQLLTDLIDIVRSDSLDEDAFARSFESVSQAINRAAIDPCNRGKLYELLDELMNHQTKMRWKPSPAVVSNLSAALDPHAPQGQNARLSGYLKLLTQND